MVKMIIMSPFAMRFAKALASFAASSPLCSSIIVRRDLPRRCRDARGPGPRWQQLERARERRQTTTMMRRRNVVVVNDNVDVDVDVVDLTSMCASFDVYVPTGGDGGGDDDDDHDHDDDGGARSSSRPGLYLRHSRGGTGRRGLHVGSAVRKGDVVLSMPLSSCLRDDEPPYWWHRRCDVIDASDDDDEFDEFDDGPMGWSTRLAALVLDVIRPSSRARSTTTTTTTNTTNDHPAMEGGGASCDGSRRWEAWRKTLPISDDLRSSLPVHWNEGIASRARSTSLEIAIDEMYFARANAISRLSRGWDGRRRRNDEYQDGRRR